MPTGRLPPYMPGDRPATFSNLRAAGVHERLAAPAQARQPRGDPSKRPQNAAFTAVPAAFVAPL